MTNRCPVWVHPGTEREGKRCILQVGHSGEHKLHLELKVDPARSGWEDATGIYIRAKFGESWESVDIAQLDRDSLLAWLRSGESFAENVVLGLLNYSRETKV